MHMVPKQLELKAVLMMASVFYDFWVTGPISYTTGSSAETFTMKQS